MGHFVLPPREREKRDSIVEKEIEEDKEKASGSVEKEKKY